MVEKVEKIWMDGALVAWDDAKVHVLTHTLHYGLGVFEGIRCYRRSDGRSAVFRLASTSTACSSRRTSATWPCRFTREQVVQACLETIRANRLDECYLRPLAFVGEGAMGLVRPRQPGARSCIAAWRWGAYLGDEGLEKGIRAKVSSFTRLRHQQRA